MAARSSLYAIGSTTGIVAKARMKMAVPNTRKRNTTLPFKRFWSMVELECNPGTQPLTMGEAANLARRALRAQVVRLRASSGWRRVAFAAGRAIGARLAPRSGMTHLPLSRSPRPRARPTLPIVAISDRALVRQVVVEFLHRHGFPDATGGAGSAALYRAIPRGAGGLAFVDLTSDGEDPREIIREARRHRPETTVVAIGTAMQLGALAGDADGWIETTEPGRRLAGVAEAVMRPHRGPLRLTASPRVERQLRVWGTLTRRQRQILGLLGCGVSNHRLATSLGISERAVKAHISGLFEKFKADSRTELALIAAHAGLHSHHGTFPFRA
jgi:DNA-binding NarL/FixJ family response regulator